MAKSNLAKTAQPGNFGKRCTKKLAMGHDHIHAANCGHKSFVHGDHIDYLHDGEYHCMHEDHIDLCPGPATAKVFPFAPKK